MRAINWFYRLIRRNPIVTFGIGVLSALLAEKGTERVFADLGLLGGTALIAALLFLVAFLFDGLARAWTSWRRVPPTHKGPSPGEHAGLIALYSRPETVRKAVEFHGERLQTLWLIVTPQTAAAARLLQDDYPQLQSFQEAISSPWHAWEAAGAIRRAHAHAADLGLETPDLICDLTGGTKAMTVGAATACEGLGIEMQMAPGHYDAVLDVQWPLEVMVLQVEEGDR